MNVKIHPKQFSIERRGERKKYYIRSWLQFFKDANKLSFTIRLQVGHINHKLLFLPSVSSHRSPLLLIIRICIGINFAVLQMMFSTYVCQPWNSPFSNPRDLVSTYECLLSHVVVEMVSTDAKWGVTCFQQDTTGFREFQTQKTVPCTVLESSDGSFTTKLIANGLLNISSREEAHGGVRYWS